MFVTVDQPLTADLLQILSDGALKLLMAVQIEPSASQTRYMELVGKCERSVRNFGRELLALGLVKRVTPPGTGKHKKMSSQSDHPTQRRMAVETDATESITAEAVVDPTKAPHLGDLTDAQQECDDVLRSQGVEPRTAHVLAEQCDRVLIAAALTYIGNRYPNSPPAYLVWCLQNSQKWYVEPVGTLQPAQAPVTEPQEAPEINTTLMPIDRGHDAVDVIAIAQPLKLETLLLAYAVEAATGADVRLNGDAQQTIEQLQRHGYSAEDIAVFADEVFPQKDWRGQNGERPTLRALREGIGAVSHWPDHVNPLLDGLLYRVQAIRRYAALIPVSMTQLSDLWSNELRDRLEAEARAADYCPTCELPWSMCRCGKTPTAGFCITPRKS